MSLRHPVVSGVSIDKSKSIVNRLILTSDFSY